MTFKEKFFSQFQWWKAIAINWGISLAVVVYAIKLSVPMVESNCYKFYGLTLKPKKLLELSVPMVESNCYK